MMDRSILAALTVSTAIVSTLSASPAQAQAAANFNLPAQDLGKSLREVASATNSNIVFEPSQTAGKTAPALRGRYSAAGAIERLLANSGLGARTTGTGSWVVGPLGNGSSAAEVAPRGVISGQVVDERTGAALKGALIELVDSGQQTSTDDLGEFRFAGLADGTYNIRISYLGYGPSVGSISIGPGRGARRRFTLVGGTAGEEIVVYGQRSARAQALNQERTADNVSTVVSSDQLGDFPGTTISEALRRAPAITFTQSLDTGDGANVIVRGLDPDFNVVTFNGVQLPVGNGTGRSADLGNILADSVEKVTISKTLLPSQQSGGTGGLIDIETKTPLDRPRRFANISIEHTGLGSDFRKDFLVSGTVSASFGDGDNFGLSASVQYRKRSMEALSYNYGLAFGEFLPLDSNGTTRVSSPSNIPPDNIFPFDDAAPTVFNTRLSTSFEDIDTKNLAANFSAQWKVGDHSDLNLSYQFSKSDVAVFSRNTDFAGNSDYVARPIVALGDAVRRGLTWGNSVFLSQLATLKPNMEDVTHVLSFNGKTELGRLSLNYTAGYTKGTSKNKGRMQFSTSSASLSGASILLPSATDPQEGIVMSVFGPLDDSLVQLPLLTDAAFDALNDPSLYNLTFATRQSTGGSNRRYVAALGAKYDVGAGFLREVELGLNYDNAKFESRSGDIVSVRGSANLAALGLDFDESDLSFLGLERGFRSYSLDQLRGLADQVFSDTPPAGLTSTLIAADPLLDRVHTNEAELAAYVQGRFAVGKLEVVGGARLSRTKVAAINVQGSQIFDENGLPDLEYNQRERVIINQSATDTRILPRILANYRFSENAILRVGYFQTVARPQISQLSDQQFSALFLQPVFGENSDQPLLQVNSGNPGLKPSITHNFDVSAELYSGSIGAIKAGAFYKIIANQIQTNRVILDENLDNLVLPDDPRFQNLPSNILVEVRVPRNDPHTAKLWGFELSAERRFPELPGILGGLGVYANYTYTHSSHHLVTTWSERTFNPDGSFAGTVSRTVDVFNQPFNNQPPHSGTIAITYSKDGLDASIGYTYQSRRKTAYQSRGLSFYQESVDSLDARAEYLMSLGKTKLRLFAEGVDLLKGKKDPSIQTSQGGELGADKYIFNGKFLGGRYVRLGVSATF